MVAAVLKWLSTQLPDWVRRDWFHVVKAKRSIAGIMVLCLMIGFLAGRLWAAYSQIDTSLWWPYPSEYPVAELVPGDV